jgi:hypothetical protein
MSDVSSREISKAELLATMARQLTMAGEFGKSVFDEGAQFERDVTDYIAGLICRTAGEYEPGHLLQLQRRMLEHIVLAREPAEMIRLSEFADAIGARNRKQVREAGRSLIAKGFLMAETEPDTGPEGERVLGYAYTAAIEDALNSHLDTLYKSSEDECAAAVKQ